MARLPRSAAFGLVAFAAMALVVPRGIRADAPARYELHVPDWPIEAIGNGREAAGTSGHVLFSWNGHDLVAGLSDTTGEETRDWNATAASVDASGTVVGGETLEDPASTSGIPSFEHAAAIGFSRTGPIAALRAHAAALAVDDAGTIVGTDGAARSFGIDAGGTPFAIAAFAESRFGATVLASAVNARGDIAGTSSVTRLAGNPLALLPPPAHVFVVRAGARAKRPNDLGAVPGCTTADVVAIDDSGLIAGNCTGGAGPDFAWTWQGSAFHRLPPLPGDRADLATAIAPSGTIAGSSSGTNRERAVLWQSGSPQPLVPIVAATGGRPLLRVVGASADGWLLVATKPDDPSGNVLLAPPADAAAAEAVAHGPVLPSTTPGATPPASNAEAPTAVPAAPPSTTPLSIDAVPATLPPARAIRWAVVAGDVASDGTHAYVARARTVAALRSDGTARWTHVAGDDAAMALSETSVVTTGATTLAVLDAASGRVRWSHPAPPSIGLDATGITFADERTVSSYALATGASLASRATPANCGVPLLFTRASFGCFTSSESDGERTLDGYLLSSKKPLWTLRGLVGYSPRSTGSIGRFTGADDAGLDRGDERVVLHPAARTYDAFDTSLPPGGDTFAALSTTANGVAYAANDAYAGRFELDRATGTEHVERFAHAGQAAVSGATLAYLTKSSGLVVVRFDARGVPSATGYPALATFSGGGVTLAGRYVFVSSATSVAAVDLTSRRIVALARHGCASLAAAAVLGSTAAVGCRTRLGDLAVIGIPLEL